MADDATFAPDPAQYDSDITVDDDMLTYVAAPLGTVMQIRATPFQDVQAFHRKFGLERPEQPLAQLNPDVAEFRIKFMAEELIEYAKTQGFDLAFTVDDSQTPARDMSIDGAIDGLLDLVYVAYGTVDLHGFEAQPHWDQIQRANMSKERAQDAEHSKAKTGRGHQLDVVKPEGWQPPDHKAAFRTYWPEVDDAKILAEENLGFPLTSTRNQA